MWMITGATFLFLASATTIERLVGLTEGNATLNVVEDTATSERRRSRCIQPGMPGCYPWGDDPWLSKWQSAQGFCNARLPHCKTRNGAAGVGQCRSLAALVGGVGCAWTQNHDRGTTQVCEVYFPPSVTSCPAWDWGFDGGKGRVEWYQSWRLGEDRGTISGGNGNSEWMCYWPQDGWRRGPVSPTPEPSRRLPPSPPTPPPSPPTPPPSPTAPAPTPPPTDPPTRNPDLSFVKGSWSARQCPSGSVALANEHECAQAWQDLNVKAYNGERLSGNKDRLPGCWIGRGLKANWNGNRDFGSRAGGRLICKSGAGNHEGTVGGPDWFRYTRYDDRNCETRGTRSGPGRQSVFQCMTRCAEAEGCLGFSRSHRGKRGRCYLHTTTCVLSSRANYASSYDTYIKNIPVPSATYTRHENRNCVTRGTKTGPDGQSVEECMNRCSPGGQAQQARDACLGFSLSHSGATGRCYLHTTSCVLHPRKNYGYLYDTYLKDIGLRYPEYEGEFGPADEWQSAQGLCEPRPPFCRTNYGHNGQHHTMTLARCRTLAHDTGGIGYAWKREPYTMAWFSVGDCEVYFGPEITNCPSGDITRLPFRTEGSLGRVNYPGSLANIPAGLPGFSREELNDNDIIPPGLPDRLTIAKANFGPYVTWTENWQLGQDNGAISGGNGNQDWMCYYPDITALGSRD